MTNVAIVDDHKLILNGLMLMLKPYEEINVINTFNKSQELLDYLDNETSEIPDVLLLDINMPEINGLEVCKIVNRSHPDIKIIALTNYSQTSFAKNMMRNGAKGYLLKNSSKEELVEAIDTVMDGKVFLHKSIQEQLLKESFGEKPDQGFIPELTRREKEILIAISEELTNNEIADKLFISTKTVETHRSNLLQKFDAKNTAGLIKKAYEQGIL